VKPANILVTDERQVKITDFGIARAVDAAALTKTGEVLGTPQYISPEQAEGKPATPASDVYSLGAVAYECLVGQRPYEADSPVATALAHLRSPVPELPSTVPSPLADVVRRALAKSPDDRYHDGTAFAAAVREGVRAPVARAAAPVEPVEPAPATRVMAAPVPADPVATPLEAPRESWARRVPLPVWAAAGVLVLVVAVAALASLTTDPGGSSPGDTTSNTTGNTTGNTSISTTGNASTSTHGPTRTPPSSRSSATSGPPSPKGGPGGKHHGPGHGKGKGDH
jgi:serine/threonine protein kinase